MKPYLVAPCLFFLGKIFTQGADWPTYGGPQNNHCSDEQSLRLDWGDEEPELLWKHEVGLGYSSVIEAEGLAYCLLYTSPSPRDATLSRMPSSA